MPERRTLYDGDEVVYPRTIASEVYVSDGVTFEDEIAESLALIEEAEQALIDGLGYKTYTVRIDLNNSDPETACEYMDNAVGKTPGYDGWKDTNIIKNIKPCVLNNGEVQYYLQKDNYTLKEDGTASLLDGTDGDVMVEIPKIGYRLWKDSNYQYVSVTEDPNKDGYCYYAHSLETDGDCDKIYYGTYLSSLDGNNLHSRSGVSPSVGHLSSFRTYAANRGTGYSLESFFPRTLMQCLFVVMYKNLNSQAALGQGLTSASGKVNTGDTDSLGFCYGTTSSSQTVKFLGIEDFWGNVSSLLDGIYYDSNFNIIKTDYRNSQFTGTGHDFQFNAGQIVDGEGYISKILGNNIGGFVPVAFNGSNSTYFADKSTVYPGFFLYCGGSWDSGANAGAFLYNYRSALDHGTYIGARLLYKHKSN